MKRATSGAAPRDAETTPADDAHVLSMVGRLGVEATENAAEERPPATTHRRPRGAFGLLVPLGVVVATVAVGSAVYGLLPSRGPTLMRLSGIVGANKVIVAAKVPGRIQELKVDEGAWVTPGQVIAVMDSRELETQRQQQLEFIRQLSAKLDQAQQQVTLQGDRSSGAVSQADAQQRVAQSQIAQASAELEQARTDAARTNDLAGRQLVPRQEVDQAATRVKVAEAQLASLQDQLRAAHAEAELARANARQVQLAQGDVDQIRAEKAQAEAQLAQIAVRLNDSILTAPMAGMVSLRVASQGEVVNAGDPTVTLVDLDHVWVQAEVPESYVTQITVGQTLDVALVSGERLSGKVIFVSPEAQFATERDVNRVKRDVRTFAVKVEVPNRDRRIHPGMSAYVYLKVQPAGAPPSGDPAR